MRFLGLGLADAVPDANTIWTFREALTRAKIQDKPACSAAIWIRSGRQSE
jgi:transposase, IS5 family